jgi:nucleoside-diphosphate-sugar epimerase
LNNRPKNQAGSLSDQHVLVTGGGGFLGRAIVKRLRRDGVRVRSFSRQFYPDLETLGVEQIQGDIRDAVTVNEVCRNMEIVFHTAAKIQLWGDYQEFFKTNVSGTENIIQACKAQNIHYLVYTSSPSVVYQGRQDALGIDESAPYPEHYHSHYQKTKAMAEQRIVQASGNALKTVVLRPHLILGPEDRQLIPRIVNWAKHLRIIGDGQNLVDWTFIDNAASAHVLAAQKLRMNQDLAGNIYFISQGRPTGLWTLVNHILVSAGKEPVTKTFPKDMAYFLGWLFEIVYTCLRIKSEPKMTRGLATELARNSWFDISAAKNDLEYEAEVSNEEGLERIKAWLNKQYNLKEGSICN